MTTLIPKFDRKNGGSNPVGAINRPINDKLQEILSVMDFGATGDGVTDDTVAIRNAIAAVQSQGYGGEIYFPVGKYRITSTIQVSDMRGVRFIGCMGTINNNPTTVTGVDDSKIFWDGANSIDPMFYFQRGHNVTFEHLCFAGMSSSTASQRAFVGVWVDEAHQNYRFYSCKFFQCQIGIRICSGYNHSTTAWTAGYSAYDGAYNAAAASVGGYASDNGRYQDCEFGYNTIAGLSIESAQALDMLSQKNVYNTNNISIFIAACQGLKSDVDTFLVDSVAAIYLTQSASTGNIVVDSAHQEQGANILFQSINASAALGNGICFKSCGGGDININGASGTLTIDNSIFRTVSMKSAGPSLVIRNSTISSLDKPNGVGSGQILNLENCNITATSAYWSQYNVLTIKNCNLNAWADLFNAQKISAPNPRTALVIGPVPTTSTVSNMEGVTFSCVNDNGLILGYGCYVDGSGNIIATNAAGGYAIFNQSGITLKKFTGQTIGTTPTVTTGAYA